MTKLEEVARAMKKRASEPVANLPHLDNVLVGSLGDAWPYLARAAIEALRDMNPAMHKATGWDRMGPDCAPDAYWEATLDAILSESDRPAE